METNYGLDIRELEAKKEKAMKMLEKFLSERKRSADSGWPKTTPQEWADLHLLLEAILDAKYEHDCDGDSVIRFTIINRNVHEHFAYRPVPRYDVPNAEGRTISSKLTNMRVAVHDVEMYLDDRLNKTGYWQKPGEKKDENDQDQPE